MMLVAGALPKKTPPADLFNLCIQRASADDGEGIAFRSYEFHAEQNFCTTRRCTVFILPGNKRLKFPISFLPLQAERIIVWPLPDG
jgi:hypothetical protein